MAMSAYSTFVRHARKCQRFLKLSAEERLRAVLINKYCANCIAHEHTTESCRSGDRWQTRDRNHHKLLHMHEHAYRKQQPAAPPQRSRRQDPPIHRTLGPPPRSASSTPASSLAPLLQRHSVDVLPTALVIIETGEKTFVTAALIDPCNPTLSESVVKKLRELPLADERFLRPATISLILGADVYPKVNQPGFHILSGACTQA